MIDKLNLEKDRRFACTYGDIEPCYREEDIEILRKKLIEDITALISNIQKEFDKEYNKVSEIHRYKLANTLAYNKAKHLVNKRFGVK